LCLVIPSATVDDIDIGAFQDFMRAQGREMDEEPQPPIEADLREARRCASGMRCRPGVPSA